MKTNSRFGKYFKHTKGVWEVIAAAPDREPDKVCRSEGGGISLYWDMGTYFYRYSNHWGEVGTCLWELDIPYRQGQWRCGKILFAQLRYWGK